jgi:hypothetical protein
MTVRDRFGRGGSLVPALVLAAAAFFVSGRHAAAQSPDAPPAPGSEEIQDSAGDDAQPEQADDPTLTAGGALRLFMTSRDYRMIKRLKGVMTPRLQARFDHDSAPFNGKRGNRLAAFDFTERDLKPPRSSGKAPPAQPATFLGSVRSLWEEQGEATEQRTEKITIVQQEDGLWRIADLAVAASEKLRFNEAVNGVTALRAILRAWHRGDAAAARTNMTEAFLRRCQGKDEAFKAMFTPPEGRRHAAYQISEMTPQGTIAAVARVRLYETVIGEPGPLEGQPRTIRMVRKGSRWLLDAWD